MFATKFFGQNIPQNSYTGLDIQEILTHIKKKTSTDLIKNKSSLLFKANIYSTASKDLRNYIILYNVYCYKDFLVSNEGILCHAEYKFQKVTTIPLRLRIGSLDYTNYLEQKPNALKPN
jgi:hypothetical protein